MKKLILCALASVCAMGAFAQDTYLDAEIVNTDDVIGTSRFVGMGGAIGALGADISTISSNPAGIAFMSKTNVSFTAGGLWMGKSKAGQYVNGGAGTFDQAGIVTSFRFDGALRNINFAFNYQRRKNYLGTFFGEVSSNASWAHQLDDLSSVAWDDAHVEDYSYTEDEYNSTIYGTADYYGLHQPDATSLRNSTVGKTSGAIHGFDFNISGNINDRVYWGFTAGIDNVRFYKYTDYLEERNIPYTETDAEGIVGTGLKDQSFGYINEQYVRGTGYNFKFGVIVRPFKESTFRMGLAVETPTWYSLTYNDDQSIKTHYTDDNLRTGYVVYDPSGSYDNPQGLYEHFNNTYNSLNFRLTSPWKIRLQAGSTVSDWFAWGAEYEVAGYQYTSLRYPNGHGSTTDSEMNNMTRKQLRAQHSARLGVEFKPIYWLSLRGGYNFISSIYRKSSYWDPVISYNATDFPTGLQYMNLSHTHILTLGAGVRYKCLYFDLAYKYRHQTGDFYAFNSDHTVDTSGNSVVMDPICCDMSRHQITATLGVKF